MAVTVVESKSRRQSTYTITITADGSATLSLPDLKLKGMTFQSDGTDGGGTLTVLVSNDGTNFVSSGFSTSADPRNATMVTSVTASGAWIIPSEMLSFKYFRFTLTGATAPTLVITANIELDS